MKKVVEAVKYGIETLKLSPEELFSLFKVVHTEGVSDTANYPLWLAGEILKIAEKEGVGYSQLMVKKFAITQTILEGKEAIIKESYLEKFKRNLVGGNIYTEGYPEFGGTEVEINWENGMDYDEDNAFFFDTLPEGLCQNIKDNSPVSLMVRLSMESCSKSSELVQDAKARSVSVKTEGGAVLYRLCLMSDMFLEDSNFKVGFLVNTDFLTSELNSDVIRHFLRYFKYKGLVIPAIELFEDYSVGGSFAFMVCTPRLAGDVSFDSVMLKNQEGVLKRYSRSKFKFSEYLKELSKNTDTSKPSVTLTTSKVSLLPEGEGSGVICNADTLEECMVYYSVVSSLLHFGFPGEIPVMVTGDSRYTHLVGNCLPLFVFGGENFIPMFGVEGYSWLKYLISEMYEEYIVQFSYEAKYLTSVCSDILDRAKKEGISCKEKTFNEIRRELNSEELNRDYLEAVVGLMGYIKTYYREMA